MSKSIRKTGLVGQLTQDFVNHWTFWSRTQTTLNVQGRPFGAKGDGTTDDTAAIQLALDAAGTIGGAVYLPEGTYIISTHLDLPSGVMFYGSGWKSIIKMADGVGWTGASGLSELVWADLQTDIVVANLQLDGNKSNQPGAVWNHGIRFRRTDRVYISGVYAHDFAGTTGAGNEGAGIDITGSVARDVMTIVSDCICSNNGGIGISTYRTGRVIISNCHTFNNGTMGISLSGDTATIRRNVVANCVSYNNGSVGVNLENQNHVIVSNLITWSNGTSQAPGGGIRIQEGKRIVIDGFISHSDRWGITCGTGTAGEPADVTVGDFVILTPDNAGMDLVSGTTGNVRWVISNGFVLTPTTHGIHVGSNVAEVQIDNVSVASPGGRGIYIENATRSAVRGCVVSSPTSYGIEIASSVTRAIVEGNQIDGGSADGIRCQATGMINIANNICRGNSTSGILITSASAVAAITGNTCFANGQHGISLNSLADERGATVTGNVCNGNSTSSSGTYNGILLNNCVMVAVVGNTCGDDGITGTATQGRGIRETGTCDYNTYGFNVLRGNSVADLTESGANNKAGHNIGSATHDT